MAYPCRASILRPFLAFYMSFVAFYREIKGWNKTSVNL